MNGYIEKTKAINIVNFECGRWKGLAKTIIEKIQNLHSEDIIPVVRCKNCKSRNINGYCTKFQNNISGIATSWFMPNDDDFCSYGEEREKYPC